MLTYKEALAIAREQKTKINYCTEYSDAYAFGYHTGSGVSKGGDNPIVVMKEDGQTLNFTAYAKRNTDGIALLFESKKVLTLIQTLAAMSNNETVNTIGEISKNYDGVRIGFDFKK